MKKAVAFLLAFLIFVAPVTTLVKADVVIGDNDDSIMNENATILGRKLAMLESLSDLALSGVTEFTISNTEDVDSYLDYLWSEVNDAIDYLDSGEWVDDIPDKIASKYYTNLVTYRDLVNNRGEFLGFDLQNPATSLLKTYFANDTYGKKYTSTGLYQSLDMLRALSDLNRNTPPTPNPDPNYQEYINRLNARVTNNGKYFWFYNIPQNVGSYSLDLYPVTNYTWTTWASNGGMSYSTSSNNYLTPWICPSEILDIYINYINGNFQYNVNVNRITDNKVAHITSNPNSRYTSIWLNYQSNAYILNCGSVSTNSRTVSYSNSNLANVLENVCNNFKNVNLYVNGVLWSYVGGVTQSPTIDIDGLLKIYGNDQPQQYELQPKTQIDYDQLYQVIYNAIRDNLPISQGDINYYDSHDTIYSPTIINNYGDEEGDESDLIDTILDYAVIPKFDTSIAQPMRQALTNGVVIMNNSITNVIPDEILLILGACFFLLLFAVVINRMIK